MEKILENKLSRRDFLRTSAVVVGSVVTVSCIPSPNKEEPAIVNAQPQVVNQSLPNNPVTIIGDNISGCVYEISQIPNKIDEYIDTAGKALLSTAAGSAFSTVVRIFNPDYGIEWRRAHQKRADNLLDYATAAVSAPLEEEIIFRLIPSNLIDRFLGRKGQPSNDIGILSSIVFAYGHNFYRDKYGEWKFDKSVPIPHFIWGMFFWSMMRERGFAFASFGHFSILTNNFISSLNWRISRSNREI